MQGVEGLNCRVKVSSPGQNDQWIALNHTANEEQVFGKHALRKTSLQQVLSDTISGSLMDDAMVIPCGHSFGSSGLLRVKETNICSTCGAPVPADSMIPNYALRAAVLAYKCEGARWKRESCVQAESDGRRSNRVSKLVPTASVLGYIEFYQRRGFLQPTKRNWTEQEISEDMQIAIMRPFSLHEEGLQHIFHTGCMPQSMSLGILSLIPKGGDASTLRQWRPLTLMSSDRSILDNVVTIYETVEWARQTKQPTMIMLLDFERAYDGVDGGFLEGTLSRMGFPDAWIQGISALYRSASAAVTIGGHVGRCFTLSRLVRHCCPLAPYLFPSFVETMTLHLRGRTPQIQGLHMPIDGSSNLVEEEYVDDTMIFC
ncbi:hypothetical protein L7F22_065073 [Adiantum nelumboides]|nr:hypothetical protein [Adiantum nelumboides]